MLQVGKSLMPDTGQLVAVAIPVLILLVAGRRAADIQTTQMQTN